MKGIKDIIIKGSIFAVLSAVFCMGGAGRGIETAWAEDVKYVDADGTEQICENYTVLGSGIKNWSNGWYVLNSPSLTISNRVDVNGEVNLILGDGCTLTAEKGITVGKNQTLNIYCQSGGSGKLIAGYDGSSVTCDASAAGIGGSNGSDCGTVVINGGEVKAYGSDVSGAHGAGIGGGVFSKNANVTINGGKVTTIGSRGAPGIGVVNGEGQVTVTINGGEVEAVGGQNAAGIGGCNPTIDDDMALMLSSDGTDYYSYTYQTYKYIKIVPAEAKRSSKNYNYGSVKEALEIASAGDTVTLRRNVKTDDIINITSGTADNPVILDLNGHTIDRGLSGNGNIYGSVISIKSSGNLTLSDNSIDQTGLITGGNTQGAGGGVIVRGTFTMNGGTISGNNGGGVYVTGENAAFNMTDGRISGNTSSESGGGVYLDRGSFNMTDGEISGNTSSNEGGGVCVNSGTFNMNDGMIFNNKVDGNDGYGGGVFVTYENSSFTMKGGTIFSNNAIGNESSGGGVCVNGGAEFIMESGTISGNKAGGGSSSGGGGVALTGNDSSFTMKGGIINGNTSGTYGGGVYFYDGTFHMTGGEISGNTSNINGGGVFVYWGNAIFKMTGGKINNNTSGMFGGGVFVRKGTFNITGGKIKDNKGKKNGSDVTQNVYLKDGKTITISGNLAETTSIGITTETAPTKDSPVKVTSGWKANMGSKDPSPYLTSDDPEYELLLNDDEIVLYRQKVSAPTFTPEGGTYTPAQSVTISSNTPGADIYYTVNGSDPTTSSTKYTAPVSVTETMTIKAIAVKANMWDSEVTSATYTIEYAVTVENGSGGGDYEVGATVTIIAADPPEGKVFDRWTGDGVTFANAASETTTFTMPAKAVTVKANYRDKNTVAAPTFTPDGGNYTAEQSVSISCSTKGAVIYYTVDGTVPSKASAKYTESIPVKEDMTIKAFAVKDGMNNSAVSVAKYTIGEEPVITRYKVTVNSGTGDGEYEENATVTIKANDPAEGKVFDKWTSEDGVEFADASSPETTFTMPGKDVTVTAAYKDKEADKPDPDDPGQDDPGKKDDPGKEDDPGQDDPKPVNPDPANPDSGKVPDKVPVTDPTSSYASPEDNFAPVAPGSSEGTGGNIKKLELDFSNVKASGVDPSGLKMTAINGSKFTTKAKVKDKNSVHTDGGVKAKFNKKDGTVTITCKNTGKATFDMEDGYSYTVAFTVEKPKPNKSEGKLTAGSAPVTKTVKDLFGTSITGGKLQVLKEKVGGQVTPSGNGITINPAEKNTIKIQYQYLNKKYKMSIKIK